MPSEFGGIPVQTAPSAGSEFGGIPVNPPDTPGSDIGHPVLGPSPTMARVGNEVFRNLAGLPAGIWAFIKHPIETAKAYAGRYDVENPEQSSGLLGMPDVLARKVEAGQTPEAIGDIATFALPGTFKEGGLEATGAALNKGVATGLRKTAAGIRGGVKAIPTALETSAARLTGAPQIARGVIEEIKKEGQPPQNAPGPPAAPAIDPALQAMRDQIAKGFKYKNFDAVTDPGDRATIQDLASRINSGATPAPAAGPGPVVPKTPSGQDIIRGSSNIPLSRQGYAEAHRLADATAGQWDEIHTSPLDRAQETAQIIADVNPQAGPVKPTEALTPWYLGAHEGQPTTAVLDKMQDLIRKPDEVPAGRGPQSTKPGQSFNDFKDEFLGHVQDQIENYQPGQKILNATHYRDTRVLQAWAKAGAPDDLSIDVPIMLEKGEVKPGDMLRLDPKTKQVESVSDASQPGIYFARHGATEWNAENGTVNPAESAGAPGPRGIPDVPHGPNPAVQKVGFPAQRIVPFPAKGLQPPPEELARLNAGAAPEPAPAAAAPPSQSGGMFLRNYDLDRIARTIRSELNRGTITKSQAQNIIGSKAAVENLRDQLGLKGRYNPAMSDYLAKKVDLTQ